MRGDEEWLSVNERVVQTKLGVGMSVLVIVVGLCWKW